jgi:hypothetical protein
MNLRVVTVDQTAANDEIATRGREEGADVALVMEGATPTEIVELPRDGGLGDRIPLRPGRVHLRDPDHGSIEVPAYAGSVYVVLHPGGEPMVRRTADLTLHVSTDTVRVADYAPLPADRPQPLPDPTVAYVCELGDIILQALSSPNRRCPRDQTKLVR